MHRIDPYRRNIHIDSCSFNPIHHPEDEASLILLKLSEEGTIVLNIAHSVKKEIEHPNTPDWVKREAGCIVFTLDVGLTQGEKELKRRINEVLAGDGKIDNCREDAEHIFECNKYGGIFVTVDKGILRKRDELHKLCGVDILLPSEVMALINDKDFF